jgi:hypothetical protein
MADERLREFPKEQTKCENLVVGIVEKIVCWQEKRKVKRSCQFTLSLKRNTYVAIAIRFFVNLIASIDLDKLLVLV